MSDDPTSSGVAPRGRVLVSGASGLVGRAVCARLEESGYATVPLTRRAWQGAVTWDVESGEIDTAQLPQFDAVLHLAGENIAGRWNAEKKHRIRESRVAGTELLARALAESARPPALFVQASAMGYYGDRGGELLRESSGPGAGFLAGVCRDWEAASRPLEEVGTRVVRLRIGMVLSADGGALPSMIRPIRLGVGGRIGSGMQIVSWIALEDLVDVIRHVFERPTIRGALNCVAPETVTNQELTAKLARRLRRPAWLPLPAPLVRLALGQMADEVLLASARVDGSKLLASGFRFRFPSLGEALDHVLEVEAREASS